MRVLLCLALACGGSSSDDEVLERELAAEEASGDETEHEVTTGDRFQAAETRVFEACYDEIAHLDEAHRGRRELRLRRLSEREAGDSGTGLAVEREQENAAQSDELPSNVDDTHSAYDESEQNLIALENELDAFHREHAHPDEWSDADLDQYEDMADRLVEVCASMR